MARTLRCRPNTPVRAFFLLTGTQSSEDEQKCSSRIEAKHFMDDFQVEPDSLIGLSCVVDVYDRDELFASVDNDRVVELSRLGGRKGFAGVESVLRSTGIAVRRLLSEHCSTVDLAQAVCQRLLKVTGLRLQDFSAVLLCHSHTDPAACERLAQALQQRMTLPLHSRFGLPEQKCSSREAAIRREASLPVISAFNFGCSGFMKLLQEGVMHLAADDRATRVLLLNIETPEAWHDGSDRLFCGIVSAGATAAVIERGSGLPIHLAQADDFPVPIHLRINPAPLFHHETEDVFCFRGQAVHRTVMRMNAEPVFLNGIELMLSGLRTAAASIDRAPGQRVIVVPHQPSGKLLKALIAAARPEFPGFEFLNNLKLYGNTISASVPTILARLPEVLAANGSKPLRDGDHIILLAAGICMDKMADHMSAGHACLQWVGAAGGIDTTWGMRQSVRSAEGIAASE